ncbi:T-cell antigen CD7 [Pelodiscus sinensis]|uniref:T-cell antigen CD7 n=1 Tax=Pelodiscus sinensis TaxID=13735 RepID=UPI003F6BDD3A
MPWTSGVSAAFLLSLLFWAVLGQNDVTQEPAILMVHEGESVNITCSITNNGKLAGMYLRRVLVKAMHVVYIRNNSENHTANLRYKTRIESAVLSTGVRITLHGLQKNDTDLYVCQGSVLVNGDPRTVSGQGTMLVVKDMEQAECHVASWVPYALSFLTLLLVSVLGFLILSHVDIKKHCQKGKKNQANMVYEDMSFSRSFSTMGTHCTTYKY